MSKADEAVNLAIQIANDDTHGYSQYSRTGNPDFDCSSLLNYIWDNVGVDVSSRGATYTGNMAQAYIQAGFRKVNPAIEELKPGDVLLNHEHHTALYIGNNQLVQAAIAENGTIHGQPGDQTGKEIAIYPYYDFPWNAVLRYEPAKPDEISYTDADCVNTKMPVITLGEYGPAVAAIQGALKYHGFNSTGKITGVMDTSTKTYLINFQRKHGLEPDGICGNKTWNELMFWR